MTNSNKLTKREIEVKDLALQGLSNKKIAEKLNISVHTVKAHLSSIFEKLNIKNKIEILIKEIDRLVSLA